MMSAWTEGLIKRREKADRFAEVVEEIPAGTPACRIKPSAEQAWQSKKKKAESVRFFCGVGINLGTLRDTLSDKDLTSFVIVLAAERLPVLESIELHQQLGRAGVTVGGLVVSKRSPEQQWVNFWQPGARRRMDMS